MQIPANLFKAYDIRGVVGTELTVEIAEGVGRALADFLPKSGPVAVGYDMRPDSFDLATAVRNGLTRQGRQVIDIGEVTSDMIYFAVGHLKAAGGAMVTASHNPGQYNGIKICRDGAKPLGSDSGLEEIRDAVEADDFKEGAERGSVTKRELMSDWVEYALGFVEADKWPAYRVAIDCGNGMAGEVMPHLAEKIPLKITPLYWELDGTFPNHVANPMLLENNRELIKRVKADKLDFGVAFDGDGDRAFLIDDLGRFVSGSVAGAIMAHAFAVANPGASIIYDARVGHVMRDTILADGGKPVRSRVGHNFIEAAMREHNAPFGAEAAGHYYFRDNFYADSGLISALVLIDQVAKSGRKLSELVDHYTIYATSGERNFELENKAATLAALKVAFADGKQDELDGLTVSFGDWWFNARTSNTEPYLRLNVEANDQATLDAKLAQLTKLIDK